MLNERELGAYLRHATRSLFRLETLPAYDVPTDRGDFPRYLSGETAPDMERKGRWLAFLREQRTQCPLPGDVVDHDFWLVDHEHPVRMHYGDGGRFLGATVVDPAELGANLQAPGGVFYAFCLRTPS